mgnify:CR=1 FL=1
MPVGEFQKYDTLAESLLNHPQVQAQGLVTLLEQTGGGDILSQVWGPEYREDLQFLRVWVSRLRAKLGGPGSRLLIRTVRGVGYRLEELRDAK